MICRKKKKRTGALGSVALRWEISRAASTLFPAPATALAKAIHRILNHAIVGILASFRAILLFLERVSSDAF